jgi:hypothetical protein
MIAGKKKTDMQKEAEAIANNLLETQRRDLERTYLENTYRYKYC